MLTDIEKKIVEKISNNIIDYCLDRYPDEEIACIRHRADQTHIVDAISYLPKDHPVKKELPKISEIANNIKEDTAKWAVLRGIM